MGEIRSNFNLTISSDGSEIYSARNSPSDFKIQFPTPLDLSVGKWSVGLTTLQYPRYIANIDSACYMKLWNGFRETVHYFPKWSCPSVQSLSLLTESLMKSVVYSSTSGSRVELTKRITRDIKVEEMSSGEYRPARHLEQPAVLEMFQKFGYIAPTDFPWDNVEDSLLKLPHVSTDYHEWLKHFGDRSTPGDDQSTVITNAKLLSNATLASSIALFKELRGSVIYEAFSAEPDRYEGPRVGFDLLERVFIQSASPEFDFCFSDTLRKKLGFTDLRFSEERYARRRFFSTYLLYMSQNPSFINAIGLINVKRGDVRNRKRDQENRQNNSSTNWEYYKYIKKVVNVLLKIRSEQVWSDFAERDEGPNTANIIGMPAKDWLQTSKKWSSFFKEPTFSELADFFPADEVPQYRKYRQLFRDNGSLIAYYMIYTLITELPLREKILAATPPQVNFPYDTFFIYSDIVKPQTFNESHMPLLTLLQPKLDSDRNTIIRQEVKNITYSPCVSGVVPCIRIYIASTNASLVPFMLGPVIVQLHFIQHAEP